MAIKPFSRQNFASRNFNVINATPVATYSLSSLAASYNEGDTITITITTGFIVDGTVLYWTTSGTSTGADFSDGVTSGSVTITNNTGTVTRTLLNDLTTEGTETFVFELRTGSISGPIVASTASANVLDTSISPINYSVLFNGSSQYLTVPSNAAHAFGTGDFTIEFWIYNNSLPSPASRPFSQGGSNANGEHLFIIYANGSSDFAPAGTPAISTTAAGTFVTGAWQHVAICRSGSTVTCYVNGVSKSSGTSSYNHSATTAIYIGGNPGTSAQYTNGYISNLRTVKGTAVYTAAFSPPTVPLTAIANTSLLTCKNATISDSSTNAFTITNTGTTLVSGENPFGNYSMSFNGSSQYLNATNAAFAPGTGDFTIECWAFYTGTADNNGIFHLTSSILPGAVSGLAAAFGASGQFYVYFGGSSNTTTGSYTKNTWLHIALVRSGTTTRFYVNGVGTSISTTDTTNYSGGALVIGGYYSTTYLMVGYISNFRIVKGTAVYTANFTPPTAPLTAISNTSLLIAQYPVLFDNSTNHFTVTNNNTTPAVTANPFDSYAYAFNGSSQYLTVAHNTALDFGTGDFTVEFWMYAINMPNAAGIIGKKTSDATNGWQITYNSTYATNRMTIRLALTTDFTSTSSWSLNTWDHWAVTRSGTTVRWFKNGVLDATGTSSANLTDATAPVRIGLSDTWGGYYNGYLSNIRVVKGTAVYTSTFTPSTSPLTAITNTSLLTAQYAELFDASTNNFAVTPSGSPPAVATNLFAAPNNLKNYSGKFNGSSQYVSIAATHNVFATTSENFTIEAWVYLTSLPTNSMVCGWNKTGFDYFDITSTSASLNMNNTYNTVMNFSFATNTWYHVAFSRTSNIVKGFVNGNLLFTGSSDTAAFGAGSVEFGIGRWYTTPNWYFPGYISNFRFIKGTGLYTSAFTPSATPLLPVSGTTLLTLQTNRIYDSGPNQYTITNNGSTTMSYLSPFST